MYQLVVAVGPYIVVVLLRAIWTMYICTVKFQPVVAYVGTIVLHGRRLKLTNTKKKKHAVGTEETLVLATGTVESACMHLSLSPLSPAPYSQQEKKRVQFFFFKKSENFRIKYIYT
jgi:hypothetical protein